MGVTDPSGPKLICTEGGYSLPRPVFHRPFDVGHRRSRSAKAGGLTRHLAEIEVGPFRGQKDNGPIFLRQLKVCQSDESAEESCRH